MRRLMELWRRRRPGRPHRSRSIRAGLPSRAGSHRRGRTRVLWPSVSPPTRRVRFDQALPASDSRQTAAAPPWGPARPPPGLAQAQPVPSSTPAPSVSPSLAARPAPSAKPVRSDRPVRPAASSARGKAAERIQTRAEARTRSAASVQSAAAAQAKALRQAPAAVPWYERAKRSHSGPGQRHCGVLEKILHRQWAANELPPPQIVLAVDRLAELPQLIKERLVAGLDAIYVGPGGVPDLDDMASLSGMSLPSGRATWDACAGAYGERKVIVGSRPSPTPDVMCHEIGHALDDIDGNDGGWQSDSAEFGRLYGQCAPWMRADLHQQAGHLGRREFFADAFAAIASGQRPALVEMLGGNTRVALQVMLYFNARYGI